MQTYFLHFGHFAVLTLVVSGFHSSQGHLSRVQEFGDAPVVLASAADVVAAIDVVLACEFIGMSVSNGSVLVMVVSVESLV